MHHRAPETHIDLRLIVITDDHIAAPRNVMDVAAAALRAGASAIQVRRKHGSALEVADLARALLPLVRSANALLFVNDRVDVALAVGADGAHLGPDDLPLTAARRIVPPRFLLGVSVDDPAGAHEAELAGASYIGCGAVFGTSSKDVGAEAIGLDRLEEVARAVHIPVIAIGGISVHNVARVAATPAAGAAVISAVMAADDPAAATRALLAAFTAR